MVLGRRVLIVTNVFARGHGDELLEYLIKNDYNVTFIGHPFHYCKTRESYLENYKGSTRIERKQFFLLANGEVTSYFKDILASVVLILSNRKRYDLFFGLNPMNASLGILLKRFGMVKHTVFYTIDYVPNRFKNKTLNGLYRLMDSFAVKFSDTTWNLTQEMADERSKLGIKEGRQVVVPTGTGYSRMKQCPIEQVSRHTAVFLSHLRPGQGIDLILKALPIIVQLDPQFILKVIGTGPLEAHFKDEVEKMGLGKSVEFFGFIENNDRIEDIVSHCGVGIAPYEPDKDSYTWYADPGKPKVYLGCGIPVIIGKVPPVHKLIASRGAGIAIEYAPQQLAEALYYLTNDEEKYAIFKNNALTLGREFDWDAIFDASMGAITDKKK